jgi:hypothetical protein
LKVLLTPRVHSVFWDVFLRLDFLFLLPLLLRPLFLLLISKIATTAFSLYVCPFIFRPTSKNSTTAEWIFLKLSNSWFQISVQVEVQQPYWTLTLTEFSIVQYECWMREREAHEGWFSRSLSFAHNSDTVPIIESPKLLKWRKVKCFWKLSTKKRPLIRTRR